MDHDPASTDKADLLAWQYRLLPWAIGLLIALAAFFFISTWLQFTELSASMQARQPDRLERSFVEYEAKAGPQDLDYLKWKTRTLLERKVVDHRYQQVNATLLLRTWTRHLGFLTGMILSFIGGIFILTKLSEGASELSGGTGAFRATLATSSPGIVLVVVGGAIMIVSLVVEYRFTTSDAPAYVTVERAAQAPPASWTPLADEAARKTEEADLFANRAGEAK